VRQLAAGLEAIERQSTAETPEEQVHARYLREAASALRVLLTHLPTGTAGELAQTEAEALAVRKAVSKGLSVGLAHAGSRKQDPWDITPVVAAIQAELLSTYTLVLK
jgi:hypothetical protein